MYQITVFLHKDMCFAFKFMLLLFIKNCRFFIFDIMGTTSRMFYMLHLFSLVITKKLSLRLLKLNLFQIKISTDYAGSFFDKYSLQNSRNEKIMKSVMCIKALYIHYVYTHSYKYNAVSL